MYCTIGLMESLKNLFADMSIIVLFMIFVGLMFIIIELFQPSKGIFTICGGMLVALGIVFRMLGGGTVVMLFLMLFFVSVVVLLSHFIMLYFQKSQWLSQSLNLAISEHADPKGEYQYLVGQVGIATSDIKDSGTISVNDVNFHVCSGEKIKKGSMVTVVRVDEDKVFVALR